MSGRISYHKLIRDRIPEKIAKAGAECETRVLTDAEFEDALLQKVEEEASGIPAAGSREELIAEMGDVLDVLDEIRKLKGVTDEEIAAARRAAFEKKGGFKKRLFLLWSSDDGYKTNEKKGA